MTTPTLSVVVPVYNEAENILRTLGELDHHCPVQALVYIVYDFPEDTTLQALPNFTSQKLTVHPVLNTYGRGVLNAIKFGLAQAETDAILVVMGDLSDDLGVLGTMLSHVAAGSGIVCGSRYMRGGHHLGGPLFKKTLSRLAGISLSWLVGFPTHDVTNSFKLYTRKVLDAMTVESSGGFEIGMEIVVKSWISGFIITEVPATWRDRTAGESKFKLWAWLPKYTRWYLLALGHGIRSMWRKKQPVR